RHRKAQTAPAQPLPRNVSPLRCLTFDDRAPSPGGMIAHPPRFLQMPHDRNEPAGQNPAPLMEDCRGAPASIAADGRSASAVGVPPSFVVMLPGQTTHPLS